MSNTNDVDIAEDDVDKDSIDDEEVVQENICDKILKQSYEAMIIRAATGQELTFFSIYHSVIDKV
jgi:hypothetical protein